MKCSTGFLPGFYLARADVMMGGEEEGAHRELGLLHSNILAETAQLKAI